MPVLDLSAYKPVPGTLEDANQIANGFTAIQTCINGLDNNNFAAGLIFDPAKIMQSGAVAGEALIWTGAAWDNVKPPGYEFDYAQLTAASTTITGTTSAAPTTIVTGAPVTYDGATVVIAKFYAPALTIIAGHIVNIGLYEDGALKAILVGPVINNTAVNLQFPVGANEIKFTPSAGAHTYSVRAWTTASAADAVVAGAGTGGANAPAYLRITKA